VIVKQRVASRSPATSEETIPGRWFARAGVPPVAADASWPL